MKNNIQEIIKQLDMQPHPEGGYYKETYRSMDLCLNGTRSLKTVIYFLLRSEDVSHFHRIKSDEMWYYHAGSPLIVHSIDEQGNYKEQKVGINFLDGEIPQYLVPKNTIFGSSVLEKNSYSLVSCSVSPGFEFEDFELFKQSELLNQYPSHSEIITKLTLP
ncbi:MAG: cupin domain-containing protein [Crocinitomicaceae bacterium]|jgi:predicted cupin superfamily sugar epimerase